MAVTETKLGELGLVLAGEEVETGETYEHMNDPPKWKDVVDTSLWKQTYAMVNKKK
jgi:hypothetical protein